MRKLLILAVISVLLAAVGSVSAVSPTPPAEDIGLGKAETVCLVHISYNPDRDKGMPHEEASASLFFDVSEPKKNVLERVTGYIEHKIAEGNASEFRLECKFPR
ncbi:MAG: hypothetical protein M0Z79_02190 [Nitrospiraceae bacterium]|nr:hypothetical protein [Nitrospiraceae bacterium]